MLCIDSSHVRRQAPSATREADAELPTQGLARVPDRTVGEAGGRDTARMFPANAYVIRQATIDDHTTLERLAALDSQRPLRGPAVIGEIDGTPAAAISMADG